MALVTASCQGGSLYEGYRTLGQRPEPEWRRYAEQMLALIPLLERACTDVSVWALLSHERLCLLAADDFRSPWYVIVTAQPHDGTYDIRYIMPAQDAPWPRAIVGGTAASTTIAAEMVQVAMVKSRAWSGLR